MSYKGGREEGREGEKEGEREKGGREIRKKEIIAQMT